MERSLFYICCGKQSSQGEKFQCEGQGRRDPKKGENKGLTGESSCFNKKKFYASDYNSNSDSITSENQL